MKKLVIVLSILFSVSLLSSCAKKGDILSINNSKWILSEWPDKVIPNSAKATLLFNEDGRANGKSFCNSYGGEVKIKGNEIKFGNLFSTKMFCQDLAEMEDIYLADLAKVNKGKIENGKLHLYQDNALLLVYSPSK
jgi:heat shock protein HslJ